MIQKNCAKFRNGCTFPSSRANTTIFYYLDKLCHKYDCIILSWIKTAKLFFKICVFQVISSSHSSPLLSNNSLARRLNLSRCFSAPQKARDQAGKGHHWDTSHELHRQHPSSSWSPYEKNMILWLHDTTISWVSNVRQLCLKSCVKTKLVYIYYMYIILICIHKRIHQKTGALDLLGPWLLIAVCVAGWLSELHLMIGIFPLIQKNDTHPTEHVPLLS